MPKIVDRESKKKQIFKGLYKLLLTKPFHEISNKDIAKAAGVNHGVIYYYFESKEDVLLQFIDYIIELHKAKHSEWIREKKEENLTGQELITASIEFMIIQITLNQDLSKIFIEIWALANHNPKINEKLRKVYADWNETIVSEILVQAEVSEEQANKLSLAFLAFSEGLSLFSVILKDGQGRAGELLADFRDLLSGLNLAK